MRGYIFRALALPLSIAVVICLLISGYVCEPWSGLLVNLAAGFVGTILTVMYVDVILRKHEAYRWEKVESRVGKRIETVCNLSVSAIRTALGYDADIMDLSSSVVNDTVARRKMIVDIANDVLTPNVNRIRDLDADGWKDLNHRLHTVHGMLDRLIDIFGARLSPQYMDLMLEFQEVVDKMLSVYSLLPDIIGVPIERLPVKSDGSSSRVTQDRINQQIEIEIGTILRLSARMLQSMQVAS